MSQKPQVHRGNPSSKLLLSSSFRGLSKVAEEDRVAAPMSASPAAPALGYAPGMVASLWCIHVPVCGSRGRGCCYPHFDVGLTVGMHMVLTRGK